MFKKFLDSLEDPNAPLLGPNIKCLKLSGLILPKTKPKRYIYIFLHTIEVFFGVTEIIDLYYVRSDMTLLLNNLKTTMLAFVNVLKAVTFLKWQESWTEIIEYVTKTDLQHRKSTDEKNLNIVAKTTKYCRAVTFFYWSLASMTVIVVVMPPLLKYMLSPTYRRNTKNGTEDYLVVVNAWVPFDQTTLPGYIGSTIYQIYAAIFAVLWIAAFDANSVSTMVFFKGAIELLRRDSSKIFGSEELPVEDDEAERRLKNCHIRHKELIKHMNLFNSCLSPVMLLYVIVCSIMLCVTCFQITSSETSWLQRFMSAEYLSFGVSQLFLYCWHSNDVLYTSQGLQQGPYESAWWRCKAHRKSLLLLLGQFRRVYVFSAGPFAALAMPTFISILKGTYSYYTLLSKSYQEV